MALLTLAGLDVCLPRIVGLALHAGQVETMALLEGLAGALWA